MGTITGLARRAFGTAVEFWRTTQELHERQAILNRPWLHDRMHWSTADGAPALHGCELPDRPGDVPVTGQGWCPCPTFERPAANSATREPGA